MGWLSCAWRCPSRPWRTRGFMGSTVRDVSELVVALHCLAVWLLGCLAADKEFAQHLGPTIVVVVGTELPWLGMGSIVSRRERRCAAPVVRHCWPQHPDHLVLFGGNGHSALLFVTRAAFSTPLFWMFSCTSRSTSWTKSKPRDENGNEN